MIKKIKWKDHSILGNLELNLCNDKGEPYNTIILAGENGTGKTTILETLAEFLARKSLVPFDYIRYNIENKDFEVHYDDKCNPEVGFHIRTSIQDGQEKNINASTGFNPNQIEEDLEDIRHYGFSYSKARSGFKTRIVNTVTTMQVDSDKYNDDDDDDFTSVKQLFVDLSVQDHSDWWDISKNQKGAKIEQFEPKSRLFRFMNAFNSFFEDIRFEKIDDNNSTEKRILFKKNGKDIPVDSLSTGEKQIVFRGAKLLRNMKSIKGGIVLIDEPELSMHPKWQVKILDYYRNLFTENGTQIAQMILATHSDYVIKRALEDEDNVLIIVLKEEDGLISAREIKKPAVLPTITNAETNYLAFDIIMIDYHIQLYGYLQTLIQKEKIIECDKFIEEHHLYNPAKHERLYEYKKKNYKTICTYIRNAIDHPDSGKEYTDEDLRISTELLRAICSEVSGKV
ncbi:MAG: ATP-binding protein [Lachnospiraceae bacterium]|nr:ATP-binding protein [Lachnospiraceae bacterium]